MSDALRLIAENRKSRATFLDLGHCGLTELPAEIAELRWLQALSVGREWIGPAPASPGANNDALRDLSPLAALTQLEELSLVGTRVSDLSPLAGLGALRRLDLAETPLADLQPLAGLRSLNVLNLLGTAVADLSPLAGLAALRSLVVSRTAVADLSPLAGLRSLKWLFLTRTAVVDLAPLAGLPQLHSLKIAKTAVADLGPLARLPALQELYAWLSAVVDLAPLAGVATLGVLEIPATRVADLRPLAGLHQLQHLNASETPVTDLAPLAGLAALRTLSLSDTDVTDLRPLTALTELRMLNIANTPVADLEPLRALIGFRCPVHWKEYGKDSEGIYVRGCPLVNPPVEIARRGNKAILNYFRERDAGGVDRLYEAKMLILGEGGSGKTSLLRRLYQPALPLPGEQETTHGIAIHRHEFTLKNGRRFRLNVWDFGGQEIYHATHQFFLTRRSLYLLLDDTRKDHKSVSDEGFKYWLELIDLFGGHSPVLIFQNEKGGRSKAIDLAGIKGRFDNVRELYAGDLERADAADALRDAIEHFAAALVHIGEELPAHWIKVRADIEARAAVEPHITQQDYFEIYGRHMPFDRTRALHLSRYLHDLGVFLHFQDNPLLARTVILQNHWATSAVFRILDDEAVKRQYGRFTEADCARLWQTDGYAEMHPELLALMQRFELCYALADSRPQTWLAPQLLPPVKPAALTGWAQPDDLVLRFRYDFLPKGVLSRLTVRLHRFVLNPQHACVTAVLFERGATAVHAELLPSGREIELRGRGPERRALQSVVAADLDALNDSFAGLADKVDKRIPCNCGRCRAAPTPQFFAQRLLQKRAEARRYTVECEDSFEAVDVMELLDGIRLDTLPGWAAEPAAGGNRRRTLRIFLASSAELRADRDEFDRYFSRRNNLLREHGVHLEVLRCEDFLDAMSPTRRQDEYNKAAADCDVFVSLFAGKVGRFTEEEFDSAYRQFKTIGRPRIYTFFNGGLRLGDIPNEDLWSLVTFKHKLDGLGHYYSDYDGIESLKLKFLEQLEKLLALDAPGSVSAPG